MLLLGVMTKLCPKGHGKHDSDRRRTLGPKNLAISENGLACRVEHKVLKH